MKRDVNKAEIHNHHHWMNCSLFSPMNLWPSVLGEIHHFIKETEIPISYFRIQINYDNGENIRLSLFTSTENTQQLYDHLNLRFKSFFSSCAFRGIEKNVDSIFLPYPTAVIEFGLFYLPYHDTAFFDEDETRQQISWFIIKVFEKEEIDIESLTTFSYYLHICLIKVIAKYSPTDWNLIALLLQPQDNNALAKKRIEVSYENLDILTEITTEVMFNEVFEHDLVWVNQWIEFCEYSLHKNVTRHHEEMNGYSKKLIGFFRSFVYKINEALGISPKATEFIDFALYHSIRFVCQSKQSFFQFEQN